MGVDQGNPSETPQKRRGLSGSALSAAMDADPITQTGKRQITLLFDYVLRGSDSENQ